MTNHKTRLIDKKGIIIMISAISAGIGLRLYREYYENGFLTNADYVASGAAVAIATLILVFMVRRGNG